MAVRRSGAPWWSFATRTSVRWPTTSRPRRIQPRRRSSSRSPAPSSRAARSDAGTPAGSRTRRSAPARRANATRRPSRSASRGGRVGGEPPRRAGRRRARRGPVPRPREVEDEEVDRPRLEERPRHRERLVDGARDEDREPLQAHAAGHRLHGIQAPGEVHPGDEGAAGLGLRDRPQGEGRRAAGPAAPEDDRPGPREAAGREQRVELREAGGDAPVDAPLRLAGELPGRGRGRRMGAAGQGDQRRPGRGRDAPGSPGSRGALRERPRGARGPPRPPPGTGRPRAPRRPPPRAAARPLPSGPGGSRGRRRGRRGGPSDAQY